MKNSCWNVSNGSCYFTCVHIESYSLSLRCNSAPSKCDATLKIRRHGKQRGAYSLGIMLRNEFARSHHVDGTELYRLCCTACNWNLRDCTPLTRTESVNSASLYSLLTVLHTRRVTKWHFFPHGDSSPGTVDAMAQVRWSASANSNSNTYIGIMVLLFTLVHIQATDNNRT